MREQTSNQRIPFSIMPQALRKPLKTWQRHAERSHCHEVFRIPIAPTQKSKQNKRASAWVTLTLLKMASFGLGWLPQAGSAKHCF
jgi:hypothetical protein